MTAGIASVTDTIQRHDYDIDKTHFLLLIVASFAAYEPVLMIYDYICDPK